MTSHCAFVNKTGKTCTYMPIGVTPLTRTGELNGVPHRTVDGKKVTGSTKYCRNHQIHEPWWPRCTHCKMSKVDFKASGRTAGHCRGCIDADAWRNTSVPFTDPILDVDEKISPSGPWSTMVAKTVKRRPPPVETEDVRSARIAVETAKAAAQAAEDELARRLAAMQEQAARDEQDRIQADKYRAEISTFIKGASLHNLSIMVQMIRD